MGNISISVDLRIFPLDLVYAASYILLDDAYVLLDQGKENEVIVSIKPKKDVDENFGERFNEELINYAVYNIISKRNKEISQIFIQRSLLTNGFEIKNDKDK